MKNITCLYCNCPIPFIDDIMKFHCVTCNVFYYLDANSYVFCFVILLYLENGDLYTVNTSLNSGKTYFYLYKNPLPNGTFQTCHEVISLESNDRYDVIYNDLNSIRIIIDRYLKLRNFL